MILRKAEISDIDPICRIIGEAQAQMARLGIDQWQNGYPARATIEADTLSGVGVVLCSKEEREVWPTVPQYSAANRPTRE